MLLAVVGVPVVLVILFNFVALTWTVISIYKVRKVYKIISLKRKEVFRKYTLCLKHLKFTQLQS